MFECAENLGYVTWIRRLNPVRNVRVVNGRFSSRYVVRGSGLCDLNSRDISRRALVTRRAFVMRVVRVGFILGIHHNTEAILPITVTNLFQRFVELSLVLPLNVCPFWYLTSQLMSNLDSGKGFCVQDGWKIAAADDRNDHDYR